MKHLLFIGALLLAAGHLFAQKKPAFDAASLRVEWELVQNQYLGKDQSLSKLRLSNTGKAKIPASGWALYFHLDRGIDGGASKAGGFDINNLSGDWYRMAPNAGFAGIQPGQRAELDLVSEEWLVHRTDAPTGFYIVFDNDPEKGYSLGATGVVPPARPEQMQRSPADKTLPVTPASVYRRNEATTDVPAGSLRPVFPTPAQFIRQPGTFLLTDSTLIRTTPAFESEANLLASEWKGLFGKAARVVPDTGTGKTGITLRKTELQGSPEAYTLNISADQGIVISANAATGIFYGMQTLKTLLPPELWQRPATDPVSLPGLTVLDQPRFGYRGLHVDVARNFQPKSEILKLIDVMALYKLNALHLHFSDDEGWRIEIPGLPELTEVGANRGHASTEKRFLHPSYGSGPEPGQMTGSGFYSRADFIEILKFAAARHVEVIPEIELPGHARAAIKSMDARYERLKQEGRLADAQQYLLRDLADSSNYHSVQGYNDNVVCAGLPSTYTFVEKVTDELLAMYREANAPLHSIHLGGDEVPAGAWEKSPVCLALRQQKGLAETADLWYYFWDKMQRMLEQRGLQFAAWEEAGLRKTRLDGDNKYIPNPDFVNRKFRLYVWNNVLGWGAEDLAYQLANAGFQVVLGPVSNLYFDMAYQKDFNEPGYYWGSYTDVDKAFAFAPFDYFKTSKEDRMGNPIDPALFTGKERLTDYGKTNVAGIEGLIWSETLRGPESLEYMVFPKLLGLAERAWAPAPDWETTKDAALFERQYASSWSHFASQAGKRELPRLDFYAGGLNYRIPTPGALIRSATLFANIQLPGLTLRYTTDGSEPTVNSPAYTAPVPVKGTVKIAAFDRRGRSSRSVTVQ